MKKLTKLFLVVILAALIPMKHYGQTPYTQYAEDGIMLNFFEIGNPDFRLYLLHNLGLDGRFSLQAEDEYGLFILNPTEERSGGNFFDDFEVFYNNAAADFRLIDKVDLDALVTHWKESVPPMFFTSITMDLALSRAMTENNHCADSDPFCTSDVIQFQAANTSQTANELEGVEFDDGCIGSSYNPSWYHMRINTSGQFIIHMEGRDPTTSAERDIDFCMWGPFTDPVSPCVAQLTGNKIIDCCYSASYTENIYMGYPAGEHVHNTSHGTINEHDPVTGEYYILMITNFSREPCVITFTKTEGSGPGTTDCGILPGIASNDGPYCVGETITLHVTTQAGATYQWTGPNNYSSTTQNPTIPNCTYEMGGTYTCVTTVDGQTTSGSTEVIVFAEPVANFQANTVCQGEATEFTSTATTNPAGQVITSYHWDFGDGATADTQNATHTYAAAGTYQVTHTIQVGGRCEDEITQDVVVLAMPVATATANPSSVQYGGVAVLSADPGAEGSFTYHWEPANMVTNPNSQSTQTVAIQATQVFTVTVTNTQGDCSSTTQVVVNMAGSDLTATATADQYEICENASTTLHANPLAGTGNYTYSWSPANLLNSTTIQHPVATPPLGTTTFNCTVSDGLTTQEISVTINVYPLFDTDLFASICQNGYYDFYGQHLTETGVYDHVLQTQHHCDSTLHLHLTTYPEESSEFTVPDGENCDNYFWDPEGHEIISTDHTGNDYNVSGTYHRTYANRNGCDSLVTMYVHFNYTPDPIEIRPVDPDNTYPHWVVTSTEFQINSYEFIFWDNNSACHWDSITWQIEDPTVQWLLESDSTTSPQGKRCKLYVLNYVEDTVWIRNTVYNECAPQGITSRYWFICSFYGAGEQTLNKADFSVVPNPNNGQMVLHFENLTGKIDMKVYDMKGNLIDHFETYNGNAPNSMTYNMSSRSDGIYFFVATSREGTIAKKVVIKQ